MIPSFLIDGYIAYSNYLVLNGNQRLKREVLGIKNYDEISLERLVEITKKYEEEHQFYYIDCITSIVKEGKPLYYILLEANKSITYCITRIGGIVNGKMCPPQYVDRFFDSEDSTYSIENEVWSEIFILFLTSHYKLYKGMNENDIEMIKEEQTKTVNRQFDILQNKVKELATKYNCEVLIQETLMNIDESNDKSVWNYQLNSLSKLVFNTPEYRKYRQMKTEIRRLKMVNDPLILYNERSNIVFSSEMKLYNYIQNKTDYKGVEVKGLFWLYRYIHNISLEKFIRTESLEKLDDDMYRLIHSKYIEYKRYNFNNKDEFNNMVRVYMDTIKDILSLYQDVLLYEVGIDNNLVFLVPSQVNKEKFIVSLIDIIKKHQGDRKIFEFILDNSIEHKIGGLEFLKKVLANDKGLIKIDNCRVYN